MVHIVDPHILDALAKALTGPSLAKSPAVAEAIYRKAVETEWIALCEIESLMLAIEPRLYRITPRELLALFNIRREFVVERPPRGVFDANGVERISAVDLAALLIEMESRGLAVDPLPLCSGLMPALTSKRLLNQSELAAYFRAQGHVEPQATTFSTEPAADQMTGWEFGLEGRKTQTGFWVEVVSGSPGIDAIEVTPPANITRFPAPIA